MVTEARWETSAKLFLSFDKETLGRRALPLGRLHFCSFVLAPLAVSMFVPALVYRYTPAIKVVGRNIELGDEVFLGSAISLLWLGMAAACVSV